MYYMEIMKQALPERQMLKDIFDAQAEKISITTTIRSFLNDGYAFINTASNTFSNCLVKEGADDVVVINTDPDSASSFYQMCMDNPDNPFLPKIYEMASMGDKGSVVRMERLVALDHLSLDEQDAAILTEAAPRYVEYVRGEGDRVPDDVQLKTAVTKILSLSQDVYKKTDGKILPFCDIKPDNVFLRKIEGGYQLVYGDPLYPGSGGNEDNRAMMEKAYSKFGLPALADLAPKTLVLSTPGMVLGAGNL